MLGRLGFCEKWIKTCLESLSVSVLVNGILTKEFHPEKGLRQGDPLAPFLFLIVTEGLAGVIRIIVKLNLVESLEIGDKKVKVNMLQFADDTLFLCANNTKSVFTSEVIMNYFDLASDFKVNFLKSRIGGVGVDKSVICCFAAILNWDVMKTLFKYLWILVGGCHKRGAFWVGVLERIKSSWAGGKVDFCLWQEGSA